MCLKKKKWREKCLSFAKLIGNRSLMENAELFKKLFVGPGTVAHACNPSTLEAEGGGSLEPRSSRPAWEHSETLSL